VTDDGAWSAVGGASAVATNTDDYVEGNGAVGFTSDLGSATAGIKNSTITAVDIAAYDGHSLYVWVYIPNATDITNFILQLGSSASAYKEFLVTHTADFLSFYAGWNLIRLPWDDNVTTVGTPDMAAVTFVSFYATKDTAKASVAGWIVDAIIAAQDSGRDVVYYSKYGWMSSDGTFKQKADDDADFLVCDSDEYDLLVEKCSVYVSRRIGNDKDEQKHVNDYAGKVLMYGAKYPSEAQLQTESYYNLPSLEE
jgi:hypothetical protein